MSQVYEKLKELLIDSCGLDEAKILPHVSLVKDLGVDSIDMMDLLYGIEREFDIQLSLFEFEELARKETSQGPFEMDNVITEEGRATLQRLLPDVPLALYPDPMIVQQIPLLITPSVLAKWVDQKISK